MRYEDIVHLSPGPRLNLLIAAHIEGYVLWEEKHEHRQYILFQKPGEREPSSHIKDVQQRRIDVADFLPESHHFWEKADYSTDMIYAWPIAERLGIAVVPRIIGTQKVWAAVKPRATTLQEEHISVYYARHMGFTSVSAPYAICIAALLDHFVPEGWKI